MRLLVKIYGDWGVPEFKSFIPPRNFLFCLDLVGLTRLAVTN